MSLLEGLRGQYRNTLVPESLFKVDHSAEPLNLKKKEEYHTSTAKYLWVSQFLCLDIQLAIGYHCMRVKSPSIVARLSLENKVYTINYQNR